MAIRDMLMLVYAAAWLAVILLTAWRTGTVPPELWAALGVGTGALVAVFKGDEALQRRRGRGDDTEPEDER